MRVKFVAAARDEFFSIASAYNHKSEGLGGRFLIDAERTLAYMKQYPFAREPILGDTRRWRLSRFPHGMLYAVENETIYILAVGHLRRNSRFWKRRSGRSRE